MAVLYASRAGPQTTSDLYTINPATGVATSVGPIGFAVTGLAFDFNTGILYGVTSPNSASSPRHLITIDPITGAGTDVGALGATVADIVCASDGTLYGWTTSSSTEDLVTINKSTGAASVVGDSGLSGTFGEGLACDGSDQLWLFPLGATSSYYTVDSSTGAVTSIGSLSGVGLSHALVAVSFSPADVCYLIRLGGTTARLCTVDLGTGAITTIGTTTSSMDALAWDTPPTPPVPPPDNDAYPINFTEFFDRTEYYLGRNSGGCLAGTTLGATAQAGEPDPAPGFPEIGRAHV